MAPAVQRVRDAGEAKPFALVDQQHKELRSAIQELRRKIEENTTDVGTQFPDVARAIHTGEEPDRPIRGRATRDEAHALIQEGIGILPVPSLPEIGELSGLWVLRPSLDRALDSSSECNAAATAASSLATARLSAGP